MKFGENIVDGVFIERPNRYLAVVEIEGERVFAHVPDPGRLPGLMISGCRARLTQHELSKKRKTRFTLVLIRKGTIWISVYPAFANSLIDQALSDKKIPELKGYEDYRPEVKMGKSRFDFLLNFREKEQCVVEVKSVSWVEKGVGDFPDAPTERGRKHLGELIDLKEQGFRAAVVFVSQRSDTKQITSGGKVDPLFKELLFKAKERGVEIYGYNCRVLASSIILNRSIEVLV